ncbi:MAG: 3-phosphoshikimate 1-carboxyvinyltransferase [Planctomycetaceae bacterium]|nr:3-phosphoshikimate 1-carboxyvinyltransferase [Planctomycetaceae bacterium]
MTEVVRIQPVEGPVVGSVRPPGSKSITNRALICAALAEGTSYLSGALESDDTQVMLGALKALGFRVEHDAAACTIEIDGLGGRIRNESADLFIGNSGTTVRFLTAALATARGHFRLHGTKRMHERPIQDLLDALAALGARVVSENGDGCPPVILEADGLAGGLANVRSDASSQFLSGLLMAAPYARSPVTLVVPASLVSQPYIHLTLEVMRAFGIGCSTSDLSRFAVPQGRYRGCRYEIEPDASAASYFFAAAAITGGRVEVAGIKRDALQGDVEFVEVLERMGCRVESTGAGLAVAGGKLCGIDVDMNGISDTVQTLAPVALFAEGPTTIRGVAHIRHKETDRLRAVAVELRKFGAEVEEFDDGLRIIPRPLHGTAVDTYDDHRMAMSFALVGLKIPNVDIRDPGCTRKTYPGYFSDLERLTGKRYRVEAE